MSWLRRLLGRGAGEVGSDDGYAGEATAEDERAMMRALEIARDAAAAGEVPVGAVVYRTGTGEVLASAGNRREGDGDPTAHAELIAIREACAARGDWRLSDCTLVVTLEPCVMCAGVIVNARVGRVVYGASDPKAGACESLYRVLANARLNHRPEVVSGVLGEEAGELLRAFFGALRARKRDGCA